jgi:hypothetical protein
LWGMTATWTEVVCRGRKGAGRRRRPGKTGTVDKLWR